MSTAGQHHLPFEDRHTEPTAPDLTYPTLPRTDLLRRLDAAADAHRTILLSAPAGTGKTILLRTWLEGRRTRHAATRTAWITADSGTDLWTRLQHNLIHSEQAPRSQPSGHGPGHHRTELSAVPAPRMPLRRSQPTAGRPDLTVPPDPRPAPAVGRNLIHAAENANAADTATSATAVDMATGANAVETAASANAAAESVSGREGVGASAPARCLSALSADSGPVVVVIDAAHEIIDVGVLAELERFASLTPSNVTVVVAARFDPPLRWHALELRGALARFGIRELALTAAEVEELCAQHGCVLEGVVLDRVMALTDGWAALVRMAALHLAARPRDRETSLTTLARPPQLISEFLAREVITPLPALVLEFLTRTAIADSFTEELAERLTGRPARAVLDELDRVNFPVRRENRDGALWFSYPALLRARLLVEARGLDAATLTGIRRASAHSYLAAGRALSAFEQLCALDDPQPAREFIRDQGLGVVLDGDGPQLFRQLEHHDPGLAADLYVHLLRAVDALTEGEIADATAYLDLASVSLSTVEAPRFETGRKPISRTASTEAHAVDPGGACVPVRWSALLRRAVEIEVAAALGRPLGNLAVGAGTEQTGNQDIDAYVAVQDATVLLVRGEVRAGEERLRRALTLARHARHARLALRSTNRLAVASGVEGSIAGMRERAQRALDIAGAHRLMDSADALQAVVMTALAAHVQGDDQGSRYFAGVLADYGRRGVFGPGSHEHVVAQVLAFDAAPDRYRAAQSLRHSMSTLLHRSLPPFTLGLLVQSVWALLRVPDGRAAHQLVAEARRTVGEHPAVVLCEAGLAGATNRPRSVLASTTPLLAAEDRVNPLMAVLAWLLDATAHAGLGNSLKAYESMANALRRAEPEHLLRPFLEVHGVLDLLDRFGDRFGHENAFAARIRHHPAAGRGPVTHPALTTTELTVLKQLPSGRTTQQIADDLGVSINTVKTHMRGIYGKLGTSSRTDALDRARRTGLL
ncbi:LuxR C-terminal-related transcriptional regulator [Nocardia sp. NPDC059240]|uniref:LuxR C-terminal-related transcriptional regulator n=1 Tax=Nocardia sp. NPDC059240 TaxID=3346786 RepID=UPI0036BAF7C0